MHAGAIPAPRGVNLKYRLGAPFVRGQQGQEDRPGAVPLVLAPKEVQLGYTPVPASRTRRSRVPGQDPEGRAQGLGGQVGGDGDDH